MDRLERQNRRLKNGLGFLILATVAGWLTSCDGGGATAPSVSGPNSVLDVVKAKEFQVVTDDGRVLVELASLLGRGMVTTLNGKGQRLVTLSVTDSGEGMVVTRNAKGQGLVRLTAVEGGAGAVTTLNAKGQSLVVLGATVDGKGTVRTLNGKGQELVVLGATDGGDGTIAIRNGKGQDVVRLGATGSAGAGAVATLNGKGQELVRLGPTAGGAGAVTTLNAKGALKNNVNNLLLNSLRNVDDVNGCKTHRPSDGFDESIVPSVWRWTNVGVDCGRRWRRPSWAGVASPRWRRPLVCPAPRSPPACGSWICRLDSERPKLPACGDRAADGGR
jgi:hypothetical protein